MTKGSKQQRRYTKRRRNEDKSKRAEARRRAAPVPRFTLYCDESGNSGINYLDEGQPVHVIAGWLVPQHREEAWISAVDAIRIEAGVDELHGVRLLKSRAGRDTALRVLEAGLKSGCVPVSLVAWKDHALALRAVETFLDPYTNPAAAWLPTGANDTRTRIAALLCDHAGDALREFGRTFKHPECSAWIEVAAALAGALCAAETTAEDRAIADRVVASLQAAATARVMGEILEEEHTGVEGNRKRNEVMALNFPMFLNLLRSTDQMLERQGARCGVVHDATLEFEGALAEGVAQFKRVGKLETIMEDGTVSRLSTASYDSFRTASSVEHPGLQAADVLASSIGKAAKKVAQGRDLDDRESALVGLAMGHELSLFLTRKIERLPGVGSDEQIMGLHTIANRAWKRYLDARSGAASG